MKTISEMLDIQAQLNKSADKKGGFFDLPPKKYCQSPSHESPKYLHIPQGKGYRHVCPQCGHIIDIIPSQISF